MDRAHAPLIGLLALVTGCYGTNEPEESVDITSTAVTRVSASAARGALLAPSADPGTGPSVVTTPAVREALEQPSTPSPSEGLVTTTPTVREALETVLTTATTVTGSVQCYVPDTSGYVSLPAKALPIEIAGMQGITREDGTFSLSGVRVSERVTVNVVYEGVVHEGSVSTPLQVMDQVYVTRRESKDVTGLILSDGTLNVGVIRLGSVDCEVWRIGELLLRSYMRAIQAPPPAKRLRIKRYSDVVVGNPLGYYDYLTIPTDFMTPTEWPTVSRRESVLFHEFGHTVRHAADGDETHWHGDNIGFNYARKHSGKTDITNQQFAFNEGWADYWRFTGPMSKSSRYTTELKPPFDTACYWNQHLIANALLEIANRLEEKFGEPGEKLMLRVLEQNPGSIHSLLEFQHRVFETFGLDPNTLSTCPPALYYASCPPDYVDDGATCRRDAHVVDKPSDTRGAGIAPTACRRSEELDAGLCYPRCRNAYRGAGPVCWGNCPAGYTDDGATCRRNSDVIRAHNSLCPSYDKCGVTFARGCSVCPPGYANDGCTCRRDVHVVLKPSYTRGEGSVPNRCDTGYEFDVGLCYPECTSGYRGAGPVCWGNCPEGYDDHGATCYRGASVITKY